MKAWALLVVVSLAGVFGLGAYARVNLAQLPHPGSAEAFFQGLDIYDRGGQLLAQRTPNGEFHIYMPLAQMGDQARLATLAAEDRDFYRHGSVDASALARAALANVAAGETVQGGSTVSQQLIKIEVVGPQRTYPRKLQEAFLAWAMERRYTKDQILEMYLNRVYYGYGAHGLAAATKTYFGRAKEPKDLTAAQAAFLAGLLQAPSALDPKTNWDAVRARQVHVLRAMHEMAPDRMPDEELQKAEQEDVRGQLKFDVSNRETKAPHFVKYVIDRLERDLGAAAVQQGGLKIYTTLDANLQAQAERAVAEGVKELGRYGVNNGDLLAVRPATGEVLAWVGSASFANDQIGGQFDVVRSARQPGSSFKPYVYEAALKDRKITLCTAVNDRPTDFGGYQPVDYDNRYLGTMPVRRALLLSRNVPAVEVAQKEGMERVNGLAHELGIRADLSIDLAGAIGASEVTMFDHVQAYSVFANQGWKVPLMAITRVVDASGATVYLQQPGKQEGQRRVLSPAEAYLITDVLKDYAREWRLPWQVRMAAKSGTSGGKASGSSHPDAWMMAYNPTITVGTWGGNTGPDGKGQQTSAFGVNVGSTIASRFINALPREYQGWYGARPAGLVERNRELFLAGTEGRACSDGKPQEPGKKEERGRGGGPGRN